MNGDLFVYDSRSGEEVLRLAGHGASVRSVRWNPEGNRIATRSEDRTVKIWDAVSGAELLTLEGSTEAVRNVDWNHDGSQLGAICEPDGLRIWDSSAGYDIDSER